MLTLEQYIDQRKRELDSFAEFWNKQKEEESELFKEPLEQEVWWDNEMAYYDICDRMEVKV